MLNQGITKAGGEALYTIDGKPSALTMAGQRREAELLDRIPYMDTHEVEINPSSVPANSTTEELVSIEDITVDDIVMVNKPSMTSGLGIVGARVSATGQVGVTFINATGSAIDPPLEVYRFVIIRL